MSGNGKRFIYSQEDGKLYCEEDGSGAGYKLYATGYSGAPGFVNSHAHEKLRDKGPIPCGAWKVIKRHPRHRLGDYSLELAPGEGVNTFGRTEFFIHADRAHGPPRSASNGCIVLPDKERKDLYQLEVIELKVVKKYEIEAADDASSGRQVKHVGKPGGGAVAGGVVGATEGALKDGANPSVSTLLYYVVGSGKLAFDGKHVATGYSGAPGCINDPAKERLPDRGPIPRGKWEMTFEPHHPVFGACYKLEPVGHTAHGRTEFFIHALVNENSRDGSKGCIVMPMRTIKWLKQTLGVKNDLVVTN
jgi:lipoprotein-anchoring transpeptidase ErfK/SrfK